MTIQRLIFAPIRTILSRLSAAKYAAGIGMQMRHARQRRHMVEGGPSGQSRAEHEFRVDLALARAAALKAIHWTPDVVGEREIEQFMTGLQVVDPGMSLIRIGGEADGGYLVPDDLEGITACFSPGVAQEATFEADLLDRGVRCHLIDGSVSSAPFEAENMTFERLFLGAHTKPGWTSLADWVKRREPSDGELILQMDIEGSEWSVLGGSDRSTLRRFRIIVAELHDLHLLATTAGMRRVQDAFYALEADFDLVNIHPNNYEYPVDYRGVSLHPVVEATWLRKDRLLGHSARHQPHPLERPNSPGFPDIPLDVRWYSHASREGIERD